MRLQIKQIYQYLYCFLVFTFPFIELAKAIPNIILGLLAVLLPFVAKKSDLIKLKDLKYLLAFTLVLFIIANALLSNTFNSDIYVIKKLLLIVVLVILSAPITNHILVLTSFIISVFISVLASFFSITNLIVQQGSFEFSRGDVINSILITERLYFGLLCCLSIMFSLKLFKELYYNPKFKKALIFNIVICVLFILTIAARMAIISLVLIFVIRAFSKVNFRHAIASIFGALIVVAIFFSLNKNLSQRFFYSDQKHEMIENIKIWEPRYVIWNCGLSILGAPNSNILFGNGFFITKQKLINCYSDVVTKEKRKKWFIAESFNTHNEYFDLLLSYGVFAFLFFCILLAYLLIISGKNIENLSQILILVFFCTIENLFHRQLGVYLFTIVLIFYNSPQLQKQN